MADDELELDLDVQEDEDINRTKVRIKSLSEKVKEKSKEAETKAKEAEEATKARAEAEKERDFFKNFNQVSTKYQGSNEHQDKIWEKVKAGYDVEDAVVSVLNKEGKLSSSGTEQREMAAGGSASTSITDSVEKTPDKMTRDEIRSQLLEADSRGELSKILSGQKL